jgi:hypothetical protein
MSAITLKYNSVGEALAVEALYIWQTCQKVLADMYCTCVNDSDPLHREFV